jgi:hypothetical protein
MNNYSFVLNTTPARFNESECLKRSIYSLLAQSFAPDKVYLCIPYKYRRFPNSTIVDYPKWLNSLISQNKVKVLRDEDYGPSSRYVYVNNVKKEESLINICTADDDVIYNSDIFEKIWKFRNKNQLDAASNWAYYWWNGTPDGYDPSDIDDSCSYMQGVDMVLTNVDTIDGYLDFITKCHKEHKDSFLNDDLTFSYYLRYKGYKASSIENDLIKSSLPIYREQSTSKDWGRLTDTLGKGERFRQTFGTIRYLKSNYLFK